MLPYMTHLYGNPHSRTHAFGWETEKAVEEAREVTNQSMFLFSI
jgi:cysteine desulfurase